MEHTHRIVSEAKNDILDRWEQTPSMPWTSGASRQWDHLPELVQALADAALTEPSTSACVHAMIETALEHGGTRRREGGDTEDVFDDYYRLRTAIWDHLRASPLPIADAERAVLRLDMAITTATGASLIGFHQVEVERTADNVRAAIARLERDFVLSMTPRISGHAPTQ
jgi:hypothetical protein